MLGSVQCLDNNYGFVYLKAGKVEKILIRNFVAEKEAWSSAWDTRFRFSKGPLSYPPKDPF